MPERREDDVGVLKPADHRRLGDRHDHLGGQTCNSGRGDPENAAGERSVGKKVHIENCAIYLSASRAAALRGYSFLIFLYSSRARSRLPACP